MISRQYENGNCEGKVLSIGAIALAEDRNRQPTDCRGGIKTTCTSNWFIASPSELTGSKSKNAGIETKQAAAANTSTTKSPAAAGNSAPRPVAQLPIRRKSPKIQ
jgi:hypothetical protein